VTRPAQAVPTPSGRGPVLLYRFVRTVVYGFCRVFWRLSVEGSENLPAGPYVMAPVHRSNIDTPLVAMVSPRRLRFMGKDSLWKHRWSAWFLSTLGGFPVHRGTADREALRRCIEVIEGGEPLVVFPEGTRREGPLVEELFDGAAYVALKTGVPVVPVGIGGSQRAMSRGAKGLRPGKIHIVVGAPLLVPTPSEGRRASRRAVHELTLTLHKELQQLFDRARIRAGA
jgi:1-acyl-sn-glycerol-3-phosphate acyltransferase